jgi:hydrogenase expression/formation protein HypC
MRVESIEEDTALVSAPGIQTRASLALVENASPGDYVIVHAGFAIQVLSEDEARETLAILKRLENSWEA